jgi:hypothetical protein
MNNLKKPKKQPIIILIPLAVAIVSISLFFLALAFGWMGEAEGVGGNFCEASREGLIKQPANTWSNLGFMVAGLLIAFELATGKHGSNRNSLTQSRFYSIFFSSLVILLGPGSMAMHATTSQVGGFMDMLSMYLVSGFMCAYAMERFFSLRPAWFLLIFALVVAGGIWSLEQDISIIFDHFGSAMFAFLITVAIVFEGLNVFVRKKEHASYWAYIALAGMFVALVIWNLSQSDAMLCDPSSLVQGHGAWHLLCAFSLYCLFRYYVSEHDPAYQANSEK